EMAYGIMGSSRDSFLLTYQTAQPVRALYFDGESATLMGLGQMDTQMLQLFGNVTGPSHQGGRGGMMGLGAEYLRAHGLCNWLEEAGLRGPGWGFEGIVRMNAGFEMIWCDFLSPSLRLVSRMNVTAPLLPEKGTEEGEKKKDKTITSYYPLPPQPTKTDRNAEPSHGAPPPNMRWDSGREPFIRIQGWGWFDSATWHYGSSRNGPGQGEVKAKPLSCGILSYYSPQFFNQTRMRALDEQARLNLTSEGLWTGPGEEGNRTEAIKQLARRRRFHHLENVTSEEAMLMRRNSERALRAFLVPDTENSSCSGADWVLMTSEIVQRVTNQLTMLDTRLASLPGIDDMGDDETAMYKWLFDLRAQSHMFMVAYMEYPQEISRDTWQTDSDLYRETHARCRWRYTRLLVPEERLHHSLSPEEADIRSAVEEVYGTICAVLITMGFGIELAWLDMLADRRAASTALAPKAATWQENIAELTAWLGWESQYYGCKEQCAWNERCYIPMWPMLHRGGMGGGRHPGEGGRGPAFLLDEDDFPLGPPPGHDGPGRGGPGFKMPPRGPSWMGDDTDLWEPKCVNITWIMGE
ncbi:hypothetical protein M406DRAFT_217874, partial [Cryphonectria parasitica EP155]